MAGNISSNVSCANQDWYSHAARRASFICYYVAMPAVFFLAAPVHAICLRAFTNEAKKEKGYLYQKYLTTGRLALTIFMAIYNISVYWLAFSQDPSTIWFRSCYWCMWWAIVVTSFCSSTCATLCQLLSLLVVSDRMYAIWKPVSYKASHVTRNNWLIAFMLFTPSLLVNVSQCFRSTVSLNGNITETGITHYRVVQNTAFYDSLLGKLLMHSRTLVEGAGLVALVVCNAAVVYLYRMHRLRAKIALNMSNEDERRREEIERTLSLLAMAQSFCTTITVAYKAVFLALVSFVPFFYICKGSFHQPLMIAAVSWMDLLDFVCVIAISKEFRKLIRRTVRCPVFTCFIATTPVVPIRPH